jgi:uncharacterized protein (TIGR03435 family)
LLHATDASPQSSGERFEVASIRASRIESISLTPDEGWVGGPSVKVQGSRVDIRRLSLTALVLRAFNVRPYQLVAPAWLNEPLFDIQATTPQGADAGLIPTMLRRLLEERFGMVARTDERQLPVYELIVRPEGAQLGQAASLTDVFPALTASDGITPLHPDVVRARTFLRSTPETDGFMRLEGMLTLEELAQFLTLRMDLPVIDRTGLAGYYRMLFRILPSDYQGRRESTAGASEPSGSSWFKALERLGLELRRTRADLPIVVVEKISRTATDN